MIKRSIVTALSLVVMLWIGNSSAWAQGRGGGGGRGPGGGGSMSSHGSSASGGHGDSSTHNSTTGKESSVSERLADNTKLAGKLQGLLPAGTNLQTAAQGFKNLGQFVAAVHVSHNLGIPFDTLKAKMIGPPSESLGKAVHGLKPDADSKEETTKGEKQAKQDMDDTKGS